MSIPYEANFNTTSSFFTHNVFTSIYLCAIQYTFYYNYVAGHVYLRTGCQYMKWIEFSAQEVPHVRNAKNLNVACIDVLRNGLVFFLMRGLSKHVTEHNAQDVSREK